MVHLGVYLAHKLLHTPVPEPILNSAAKDRNVLFLYNRVARALFTPLDQKKRILKPISFHLYMRERFKDKRPYIKHVIQLWLRPNEKDEAFLKLPHQISFLYLLVKPFRILSQRLFNKAS